MNKIGVSDLFAKKLIVIKEIAVQTLKKFAQSRGQRTFFAGAFTIGKTHLRIGITDMQRPDVRYDITPGRDLDFHAQIGELTRHIGNGLFQW